MCCPGLYPKEKKKSELRKSENKYNDGSILVH